MFAKIVNAIFMIVQNDWAGWLFLFLNFIIIYMYAGSRKIFYVLLFIMTVHQTVSLLNAYFFTTIGADVDAYVFHYKASQIAANTAKIKLGFGADFYTLFLSSFYKIFGSSVLLGEELSNLAFILSCFLFLKFLNLLNYEDYQPLLLLIYGLYPSIILFTSIIMRESWQILFAMLIAYFFLKILISENIKNYCYFFLSSLGFVLFHEGFVFIFLTLASTLMLFQLYKGIRTKFFKKYLSLILCTSLVICSIYLYLQNHVGQLTGLSSFYAFIDGNILGYIYNYRQHGLDFNGRTTYGNSLDISNALTFFKSFFVIFLQFMFNPLPWQATNLLDVYAVFESSARLLLLGTIGFAIAISSKQKFKIVLALTFIYFLISAYWSFGTINYGTSIRHHVVGFWILIILLGIYLNEKKSNYLEKNKNYTTEIMENSIR